MLSSHTGSTLFDSGGQTRSWLGLHHKPEHKNEPLSTEPRSADHESGDSVHGTLTTGLCESHGFINDVANKSGVERHALSAIVNKKSVQVSLKNISKLCDYLVKYHDIDPNTLPGALFGREADSFFEHAGEL